MCTGTQRQAYSFTSLSLTCHLAPYSFILHCLSLAVRQRIIFNIAMLTYQTSRQLTYVLCTFYEGQVV